MILQAIKRAFDDNQNYCRNLVSMYFCVNRQQIYLTSRAAVNIPKQRYIASHSMGTRTGADCEFSAISYGSHGSKWNRGNVGYNSDIIMGVPMEGGAYGVAGISVGMNSDC